MNTSAVLAPVCSERTDAARERLASVRRAQAAWAAAPIRRRLATVRRFRHLVAGQADELARVLTATRARLVGETLAAEVLPLADACSFLEREAPALLRPKKLGAWGRPAWLFGVTSSVRRDPYGVVLILGPSNYPLLLPGVQALQALTAGNAVLLKPGAGGKAVAEQMAGLWSRAGLPGDLLTILPECAEAVPDVLAAGIDKVVLTGSAETGRRVLAALAEHLVPATLELSGYDAAFVLPGADLDLVTSALAFAMRWNRGETCIAPRRVFVVAQCGAELERRLAHAVPGGPASRTAGAQKAAPLIEEALAQGARLIAGRVLPGGAGIMPCVLADARPDMRLLREECFAPLLSLVQVGDVDEGLRAAAGCPFALGAVVFGESVAARALAARVQAGVIVINDVIVPTADPRLPFGGRGQSGYGVTRGAEGLLEMTAPRVLCERRGQARYLNPPLESDAELFTAYLRAAHGPTWPGRLTAWLSLAGKLVQRGRRSEARRKDES